jgi:hypothetical protein
VRARRTGQNHGNPASPYREPMAPLREVCSLCGGPVGLLGMLGTMAHGSCRNCGMAYHGAMPENLEG